MSIIDNLKEDVKNDRAEVEKTLDTKDGRFVVKVAVYAIIAIVILWFLAGIIRSCVPVATQPQPAVVSQPMMVPVQQTSPGYGGGTVAAAALAGYIVGQSRMPDGSIYNGSAQQRTVIQKVYVREHPAPVSIPSPAQAKQPASPIHAVEPPTSLDNNNPIKLKNPGDEAAKAEQAKMVQEKAAKDAKLKSDIAARKASIMKSRSVRSKSGFGSFSKKH